MGKDVIIACDFAENVKRLNFSIYSLTRNLM